MSEFPASSRLVYRPFTAADVSAGHRLSSAARWPHKPDDWRFLLRQGQGFVALDGDEVVGTALYWQYGESGGSLGMVIVSPDRQGRGIGRELMERMLDALGSRTTVLHATLAGQPLYEKLGFTAIGKIDQHQGTARRPPLMELPPGERLRPLGANDPERLIVLASRASDLDRRRILPALLDIADGIALEHDGELLGFSLFRRFGRGFVIGPVVVSRKGGDALAQQRAEVMIAHWLTLHEGRFVRIDTPADSGLTDWLASLGLERVDTVVKMARNGVPRSDDEFRQFAIINQAIG
ncbi:N-acetyltransferase GCN5 [Pandoraea horticolens]|uniref:N-acetyltransferase GCN5 n=1 Tax=Pandoraea horticolens TaxID=2508298 RepID=A0A5E4UNK0_9BURK|nr:GNAT family N-acetyltransferase [Pandoraea horticolens]VVE01618.1 N-acetyltransferase GCN5 [Pandoraea horticolens]